jgi:TRAP-type C4-dicarboxylate transport system permease small subunit
MRRFEAGFEWVLQLLALLTALMLAAVTVLICMEVAARNLFNSTIEGSVDLSEYALYLMTVLMAPYLLNRGQHIRIDFILTSASRPVAFALELIADLVGAITTAVLVWEGVRITVVSFNDAALIWKSLRIPEWWILAPMPLCIGLMTIEFVLRIVRLLTGAREPGAGSVATI